MVELFYLILRAFKKAFAVNQIDENKKNLYSINEIFAGYSQDVLNQFISYCFDTIIEKMVNEVLRYTESNLYYYLKYLDFFYDITQQLISDV